MTARASSIRFTDGQKRAVWGAIAPPARLGLHGIASVTGIDWLVVSEIVAAGVRAGALHIRDEDRTSVWIEREERGA